ncbi:MULTISPECIES: NADH-quinone oxidoreductase subunit NuoE [unclassified Pseudomonas]|uniref:NADH-quinone oxidoreductase subunit NuoE n=1 Tax=unclassified Pseudomonas TaxID=196821 RepID=UPI00244D454A|nr:MULTISPECIES: NADH-quinone oxidoreductase subunit NuoE [unclassified Pseudomonas]MDG9926878.1 NADH-quinone oxidoreductase subunit NuoE [Pseudomonas sp. GD04042]MDH0484671.1 NADH-quinone oxidoreductase subunit NuoE [Pseudomonas sp. GD04015]MDH0602294.1 NADH-quinone oxidoreductase subunit NuoE [Pseudomonas sp. GD03869]MDH0893999.1 NADH-quinone oxidoreductase subunit NuoE [Pseudomonas sp. GD03875]MDH1064019.1 NADH-quinone oxidoreductase subunit NuoE [Pseudomonas sp. GD03985]
MSQAADSQNMIQTDRFELSQAEHDAIEHEMHHYEDPRAASIEALKIVQKQRGWVPDGAIYAIADILGIPASDVEGVATFYSQIFRVPVGRHIIRVCDSMTCFVGGHENVLGSIKDQLGIVPGQTTADGRFTLLPVCCLGNCDKAPAVMIDDDTFGGVSADNVAKLLEPYA